MASGKLHPPKWIAGNGDQSLCFGKSLRLQFAQRWKFSSLGNGSNDFSRTIRIKQGLSYLTAATVVATTDAPALFLMQIRRTLRLLHPRWFTVRRNLVREFHYGEVVVARWWNVGSRYKRVWCLLLLRLLTVQNNFRFTSIFESDGFSFLFFLWAFNRTYIWIEFVKPSMPLELRHHNFECHHRIILFPPRNRTVNNIIRLVTFA